MTTQETVRDEAQRRAIREETDRSMFVVAGAGSGKTSALVDRIATLVLRDGVLLANIAAVTFTEKAGAELRDRLRVAFERVSEDSAPAARQALEDLDLAAIGTLHSFATRILLLHPIEAGMPPQLTPVDEVGSGIAGEEEWGRVLVQLLEDEDIRPTLQWALATVKLKKFQALYAALSADWDLIEDRVLARPMPELRVPDLSGLRAAVTTLRRLRTLCTKPDKLAEYIDTALRWADDLDAEDDFTVYRALTRASGLWDAISPSGSPKRVGSAANWTRLAGGVDDARLAHAEVRGLAMQAAAAAQDVVLRRMTQWMAQVVLEQASIRRHNGELTFQDLLVVARQVLRERADVALALNQRYTHLLLDEFQDTDPIQIEIAVRIAGGEAGASRTDWRDIDTRPGALFVVGDPKQSIYRFRRANIGLYLEVQDWFRTVFGEESIVELETNFRSVPGVVGWVNRIFGELIRYQPNAQPPYLALHSQRAAVTSEPAVTSLGQARHAFNHRGNAGQLRALEAADVSGVIAQALAEQWPMVERDPAGRASTRPLRSSDIAVLLPARTSLPALKQALDEAGIAYRADASSLLYESEDVADVLMAVQAVADRSDRFAVVMTLRSQLFGLGDDDLWRWKQAGGSFSLAGFGRPGADEALAQLPVYPAMKWLRELSFEAPRLTPAELLDRIVRERRVLEVAADTTDSGDAADRWRRFRYIVDQAQAWSAIEHGGVRRYLEWARRQLSDTAQAYESILPETDVDAVRVLTVHSAKGLEFPMVVLSGMTSLPTGRRKQIQLLWTRTGYEVSFGAEAETRDFRVQQPVDEQMGFEERKRLLYVAATRARDHLVVSLHRANSTELQTPAEVLRQAELTASPDVRRFELPAGEPESMQRPGEFRRTNEAEPREAFENRLAVAIELSRRPPSQQASGLEGGDSEVVLAVQGADDEPVRLGVELPLAKAPRDLDAPSYHKGRDATAVGTAVHAVLQSIDLHTGAGLEALVELQCLAEGVPQHAEQVTRMVRTALASELVRTAVEGEYWRESLLAMTGDDDTITEGYADLIFRDPDGGLHVVDYKTDTLANQEEVEARTEFYAPQLAAYGAMLTAATGSLATSHLLFLDAHPGRLPW